MDDESMGLPEQTSADELLNFDEALRFLGTSKTTLYRLLEQGDLRGTRVGRQWRFLRADLLAYMERGPSATAAAPAPDVDAELEFFASELQRLEAEIPEERDDIPDASERRICLLTDRLIAFAIAVGASDIHLEPEKSQFRLRLRLSGVLQVARDMAPSLSDPITIRLKQMADMNIVERRLPQDGRFRITYDAKEFDLRVSCLPTLGGESIVMRILDQSTVLIGLDRLGIRPEDKNRLLDWLTSPSGTIVTTGPTGSGKTTLLYVCLSKVNTTEKKILTIEDPVEYQIPGIRQIAVNKKAGLTFANGLRAFLRQDPDILMVGQLRDLETAEIVTEAALTGHLVLTSVHTENAASALERLRDIGIESFLTAATVRGVVAQRLVRKICPHCKAPDEATANDSAFVRVRQLSQEGGYAIPMDAAFFVGKGCSHCRNTGYIGRTGLFELVNGTPQLMNAFKRGATTDEMTRIAVLEGTRTLLADGLLKAANGITTVDEAVRVTGVTY